MGFSAKPGVARSLALAVLAIDAMRFLGTVKEENRPICRRTEEYEVLFSIGDILFGIAELFVHPWFRRAWIVQECVVSPNLTFQVGSERFGVYEMRSMV